MQTVYPSITRRSPSPLPGQGPSGSRPGTPLLIGFPGRGDHCFRHVEDTRGTPRQDDDRHSLHSTGSFQVGESDDEYTNNDSYQQNAHVQHRQYCTPHMEDRMRRRLKFFFMNPWQKWRARRKFPWKLLLQVIKVILVTIQLCIFGSSRSSHVSFLEKSSTAFKHLYLCEWDPSFETLPYPPATGQYAIYTIPQFYDHVNYAMQRYNETEKLAIGTYHFDRENDTAPAINMCKKHYKVGEIYAFNETYYFDSEVVTDCFDVYPVPFYNQSSEKWEEKYDIESYLDSINKTMNFDRIITVNLKFDLKTVHLKGLSRASQPDCFVFHITISFDNTPHNGQVLIFLDLEATQLECNGHIKYKSSDAIYSMVNMVFDGIVIVASILSMALCIRSIYRAMKLMMKAQKFFKNHLTKAFGVYEKFEFVDFWYALIIINDILTIIGSIYKMQIESESQINNKGNDLYELASMFLGTGSLLVWFGMLRYFGFFDKYNVLILTLKRCAPNVLRFVVVAGVFYVGFCFCGWVVLGPYHLKFRDLSTASECLFSLVNGDDMFVTFSVINDPSSYVWLYARIYLYTFISLFIYVVLSVFISVIMDTYETIKYYYEHGFPKSELLEFVDQCTEDCDSPLYRTDREEDAVNCWEYCNTLCCFRRSQSANSEYTSIVS